MKVRESRDEFTWRVRVLSGAISGVLGVIAATFWFVQIVQGSYYRQLAEHNRLRREPVEAPRGLIYDREGRPLVENVPSYNLLIDRSRTRHLAASLEFAAGVLERPAARLRAIVDRRQTTAFQPVLLGEALTLPEIARFSAVALEHPEFEVGVEHLRLYRHGRQTAHLLGYLGEVGEAELAGSPGAYSPGDLVGRKGIEEAYDAWLRGRDGDRVVVVNSRGQTLQEHGRTPAVPGGALTLTVDLDLQQEAHRLLAGRVGAVVALDPANGEVLALLAAPSYDPNHFARRLDAAEWQRLVSDPGKPLQNRALQSAYSPGSPFKIVMAVAGLAEGVVSPRDRFWCSGATVLYGNRFRCWKRGGHGWVDLHAAVKKSCDIYFYHLGQKLGIERIAHYARRFGLGEATGIDLKGERVGLVPDPAWSLSRRRTPWYPGETISVAIGQGPVQATPVQMAALLAVVANGGRRVTPHLVRGAPAAPAESRPTELPLAALEVVKRALWAVVNEPEGTGSGARVAGLEVAGKTGTVQVVSQATWIKNEELPPEIRDHAWFASFAPADDPSLVVVVFVEHGGRGSAAAAPIAKALYELHFETDQRPPRAAG